MILSYASLLFKQLVSLHKSLTESDPCADLLSKKRMEGLRVLRMEILRRPPEVFLGNGALKICSKFSGEHPSQSVISINIEITLRHGCFPVHFMNIFRIAFYGNTYGGPLLKIFRIISFQTFCESE